MAIYILICNWISQFKLILKVILWEQQKLNIQWVESPDCSTYIVQLKFWCHVFVPNGNFSYGSNILSNQGLKIHFTSIDSPVLVVLMAMLSTSVWFSLFFHLGCLKMPPGVAVWHTLLKRSSFFFSNGLLLSEQLFFSLACFHVWWKSYKMIDLVLFSTDWQYQIYNELYFFSTGEKLT